MEEISEKYTCYLLGMGSLRDKLLHCKDAKPGLLESIRSPKIGMDSLPCIEITIDGASLRDIEGNRVAKRIADISGAGRRVVANAGSDDERTAGSSPRQNGPSTSGKRRRTPQDSDIQGDNSGKPCWYTSWKVETRSGTSAGVAHVSC